MSSKEITDEESLKALAIVREESDVYMLRSKLSKEGHDFGYLMGALNRGVERGLYSADERDIALRQNEDVEGMCALAMVKKGAPYKLWRQALDRGVRSCLFSREERERAALKGVEVQYITACGGQPLDSFDIALERLLGFL